MIFNGIVKWRISALFPWWTKIFFSISTRKIHSTQRWWKTTKMKSKENYLKNSKRNLIKTLVVSIWEFFFESRLIHFCQQNKKWNLMAQKFCRDATKNVDNSASITFSFHYKKIHQNLSDFVKNHLTQILCVLQTFSDVIIVGINFFPCRWRNHFHRRSSWEHKLCGVNWERFFQGNVRDYRENPF